MKNSQQVFNNQEILFPSTFEIIIIFFFLLFSHYEPILANINDIKMILDSSKRIYVEILVDNEKLLAAHRILRNQWIIFC